MQNCHSKITSMVLLRNRIFYFGFILTIKTFLPRLFEYEFKYYINLGNLSMWQKLDVNDSG